MNEIVTINQNKIMKQISRYLLTLVALFAMTAGAWADETYTVKIEANGNTVIKENVTLPYTFACNYQTENGELDQIIKQLYNLSEGYNNLNSPTADGNDNVTAGMNGYSHTFTISAPFEGEATVSGKYYNGDSGNDFDYVLTISIPGYVAPPAGPEVTWNAATKTGTFAMPGYDVKVNVEYDTELALSEETDNAATLEEWDGYEADVTLTRTLQTGGWNTLALPFNVEATTLAAINAKLAMMSGSMTVKELTGSSFENGTLTLTFGDATSIEAGKPYLVKVTPAAVNLATMPFTGAEVSKTAESVETTDVDFVPTLGKTSITGDDAKTVLFLAADNKLKNPTALPADMKGFRAYFQLKGAATSARSFNLNLGDEATGINAVNGSEFMGNGSEVYDLQGRRVSGTAQKGVYVVNGKKTVIK